MLVFKIKRGNSILQLGITLLELGLAQKVLKEVILCQILSNISYFHQYPHTKNMKIMLYLMGQYLLHLFCISIKQRCARIFQKLGIALILKNVNSRTEATNCWRRFRRVRDFIERNPVNRFGKREVVVMDFDVNFRTG